MEGTGVRYPQRPSPHKTCISGTGMGLLQSSPPSASLKQEAANTAQGQMGGKGEGFWGVAGKEL